MNRIAFATLAVLCFAHEASHAVKGATAPYNEAVTIVNGKRVVEVAPYPAYLQFALHSLKKPSEFPNEVPVNSVETPEGLMDCYGTYYWHPKACSPSTFGTEKRFRHWTVKMNGQWVACVSQAKATDCIPLVADGTLRALPALRE